MNQLRKPTFAEREGQKLLPSQLQPRQLSSEVRAKFWRVLHNDLESRKSKSRTDYYWYCHTYAKIFVDFWVEIDHGFQDTFDKRYKHLLEYAKEKVKLPYTGFF